MASFQNNVENRFDNLSEDNKKIIKDLISFHKCLSSLTKFKSFIDLISDKIRSNLNSNELKTFDDLNREVEEVFKQETHLKEFRKSLWDSTIESQDSPEVENKTNQLSEENDVKRDIISKRISSEDTTIDPNYHPNDFLCDVCQKVLKTLDSLVVHKKGIHLIDQKIFFCDFELCKYKTLSESHLLHHKKRHKTIPLTAGQTFKCTFNVCGQVFKSEEHLNQHMKEEHNITQLRYKCYYGCGKRFPLEDNLKDHIHSVHRIAYKPFKCKAMNCHKMFRFESKLKHHNRIVHERQWGCPHPECDFLGTSKKYYEQHLESHSKFRCNAEGCGQTFVQKAHLRDHHLIAHPSEMLYFCEWEGCDKSFRSESGYKQHTIKHTDKVFTCDWPGCGFTTKMNKCLKTHGIIHSSELNHCCHWPECGKRFKTKARLDGHLRIHYNDKRYACHWPGCHYRCTDSGNLCKHEKQVHKRKMRSE